MTLYDTCMSRHRDMHQYKNGCKLSNATVQRMIGYGWCRITVLDADTEYITSTEEGRKMARIPKDVV